MRFPYLLIAGLLAATAAFPQLHPTYTMTTVAGNGTQGHGGDGGQGTSAILYMPQDLAIDGDGSIYIADCFNHRIRKLTADGNISTVAGTGSVGTTGDSVAATSATFREPCGVALDRSGGVFIADTDNHIVRKLSGGNVTLVAGKPGEPGFSGDNAKANEAFLNTPLGMVVDSSNNLYIVDNRNNRIRKVGTDGNITTFSGGDIGFLGDGGAAKDARYNGPRDIAIDAAGNLYIADTFNHRIRKITSAGVVSTIAGSGVRGFAGDGGLAINAQLNYPQGVAVDSSGNVYIADTANNRIRMITEDGVIATIAGSGRFGDYGDGVAAKTALLRFPSSVAVGPGGSLYFTDDQNHRVRKLTRDAAPANAAPSIRRVIISSAFGGATDIAPGAWVEIFGDRLAATTREWTASDFDGANAPTALDNVKVSIGGAPAFVSYVSPSHVNVLVPSNAPLGEQHVKVSRNGIDSAAYKVNVRATQPGLLAPSYLTVEGKQYVAALLPDATRIHPATDLGRAAKPGETITFYGTGFGAVTPYVAAGKIVEHTAAVDLPLRFYFGDTEATLVQAGLVEGSTGLYQFRVVVPQVAASDAVPLSFTLDAAKGAQALFTAVRD